MLVRDAIEKWGRENRRALDPDDSKLVRVLWSGVRGSDFGARELESLDAEDRAEILTLFRANKRDAIDRLLASVIGWADPGSSVARSLGDSNGASEDTHVVVEQARPEAASGEGEPRGGVDVDGVPAGPAAEAVSVDDAADDGSEVGVGSDVEAGPIEAVDAASAGAPAEVVSESVHHAPDTSSDTDRDGHIEGQGVLPLAFDASDDGSPLQGSAHGPHGTKANPMAMHAALVSRPAAAEPKPKTGASEDLLGATAPDERAQPDVPDHVDEPVAPQAGANASPVADDAGNDDPASVSQGPNDDRLAVADESVADDAADGDDGLKAAVESVADDAADDAVVDDRVAGDVADDAVVDDPVADHAADGDAGLTAAVESVADDAADGDDDLAVADDAVGDDAADDAVVDDAVADDAADGDDDLAVADDAVGDDAAVDGTAVESAAGADVIPDRADEAESDNGSLTVAVPVAETAVGSLTVEVPSVGADVTTVGGALSAFAKATIEGASSVAAQETKGDATDDFEEFWAEIDEAAEQSGLTPIRPERRAASGSPVDDAEPEIPAEKPAVEPEEDADSEDLDNKEAAFEVAEVDGDEAASEAAEVDGDEAASEAVDLDDKQDGDEAASEVAEVDGHDAAEVHGGEDAEPADPQSNRRGLRKRPPDAKRWSDPRFDARAEKTPTGEPATKTGRRAPKPTPAGRRIRSRTDEKPWRTRLERTPRRASSRTNATPVATATQSTPQDQPVVNQLLIAIGVVAAILAALSPGSPTGLGAWDFLLKGILAGVFVAASVKAPNWVTVVTATTAVALVGRSAWLAPAAIGLFAAVGAGLVDGSKLWLQPRILRAVAAGLAVQGLLRLPPLGFFGLPSLIAGGVIVLALLMGYRDTQGAPQRVARLSVIAIASALIVALAAGGLAIWAARADAERGIAAAREGLSAARGGDPEAVVASLEEAATALADAEQLTGSVWTQGLRLVPIGAQHRNAITVAASEGSALARQASRATVEADISSITMRAGSVDLSALSAMEEDLVATASLLESGIAEMSNAQSPWLLSPLASRMESLTDEMRSVLPEARVAADAAQVVPAMLGADEPRRYFVAFGSPAESREFGGVIGSWALLEFNQGDVRQIDAGRISDLYDLSRSNAPLGPLGYPEWYVYRAVPEFWPQNLMSSPQPAIVTSAARELFDGLGNGEIDGLVYLDGYALGAMLNLTGPIPVEGINGRLSASNATEFLFDGQYRLEDRNEVKDDFTSIFAAAFEGLLESQLPGPERLGRILGPVARQGRLQVMTTDDAENAFLRSIKLQRTFGLSPETPDGFAVVQANATASKLDLYLRRAVDYDVSVDEEGQLTGTASVTLTSRIPDDAPAYALGSDASGQNATYLSLYSPHTVRSVLVDGLFVDFRASEEFGLNRYEVTVETEANDQSVVEFRFEGELDTTRVYAVSVWHQPLVNNDAVHINYQGPDGTLSTSLDLIEDTVVDFQN